MHKWANIGEIEASKSEFATCDDSTFGTYTGISFVSISAQLLAQDNLYTQQCKICIRKRQAAKLHII